VSGLTSSLVPCNPQPSNKTVEENWSWQIYKQVNANPQKIKLSWFVCVLIWWPCHTWMQFSRLWFLDRCKLAQWSKPASKFNQLMTPPMLTTWQVSTCDADPITTSPDVIITCSTPVITMMTSPAIPTLASTTVLTLTPSLSMDHEDGHPYLQLFPVTTIPIHTVLTPACQHLQVYFFYFSIRYLLFFSLPQLCLMMMTVAFVQAKTCWKCTKCCWAAQIRSRLESSMSNWWYRWL